jgi:hypothetical protein
LRCCQRQGPYLTFGPTGRGRQMTGRGRQTIGSGLTAAARTMPMPFTAVASRWAAAAA